MISLRSMGGSSELGLYHCRRFELACDNGIVVLEVVALALRRLLLDNQVKRVEGLLHLR